MVYLQTYLYKWIQSNQLLIELCDNQYTSIFSHSLARVAYLKVRVKYLIKKFSKTFKNIIKRKVPNYGTLNVSFLTSEFREIYSKIRSQSNSNSNYFLLQ